MLARNSQTPEMIPAPGSLFLLCQSANAVSSSRAGMRSSYKALRRRTRFRSSSTLATLLVAFFLSEKLQNVMPVTEVLALFWQEIQTPERG
jgi:hypothetical protein